MSQNLQHRWGASENGWSSHWHRVERREWLVLKELTARCDEVKTVSWKLAIRRWKFMDLILGVGSERGPYQWRDILEQQENTEKKFKVCVFSLLLLLTCCSSFVQLIWSIQLSNSPSFSQWLLTNCSSK